MDKLAVLQEEYRKWLNEQDFPNYIDTTGDALDLFVGLTDKYKGRCGDCGEASSKRGTCVYCGRGIVENLYKKEIDWLDDFMLRWSSLDEVPDDNEEDEDNE